MLRVLFIALIVFSSYAQAETKLSVMGSVNYNSPELEDIDNADEKSDMGWGVGLRALMGIGDQLHFRSGAGIVHKRFSYEVGSTDFDLSFTYLNIPLTLYWKASPQVGFFGGTSLNAKMGDDCDASGNASCDVEDEAAVVMPAIIGFDFSFTERIGMEVSYEYGFTETAKNINVHSAVASFLIHI